MDDTHRNPNKIFVGGLGQGTTTYNLKAYFSQFGKVLDAAVVSDKISGRSRGFGFCSFTNEESVERCVNAKHRIDGVTVEIRRAVPRDEARGTAPYDTVEQQGKIFIGGLPEDATEESLKEYFERFGPVKQATLMYDKNNHRPRGFGFVIFNNRDDADKAVGEHVLNGRTVESKKATPRPQQEYRGRGGYGGGRGGDRFDRFGDRGVDGLGGGGMFGPGGYGRGGYDPYVSPGPFYDPYAAYGGGYGAPAGYGGAPGFGGAGGYAAGAYGGSGYGATSGYGAPATAYGGGGYGGQSAVAAGYAHSGAGGAYGGSGPGGAVGGAAAGQAATGTTGGGVAQVQDYYGLGGGSGSNGQVGGSYGQAAAAYGAPAAGGSYGDYAAGGPQRATRYAATMRTHPY